MPTESDDDDHDVILSTDPTFVSVDPGQSQPSDHPANPSDHQDRPVNAKPTAPEENTQALDTASPSPPTSPTPPMTPTAPSSPTSPISPSNKTLPVEPPLQDDKDTHFLPHYFPTFGVSKRTQIWIYGALAIIMLFCAGLGAYFFIQRRKRRRNEREDYEFEMLEDQDAVLSRDDTGGKKQPRRAGELYDAFAGESDEEQLLSDEGEEEEYHDEGPVAGEGDRGIIQSRGISDKHN